MAQTQYLDQQGLQTLWSNIKMKKAHYSPTKEETIRASSNSGGTEASSVKKYNVIQDLALGKDSNGHIVSVSANMLTISGGYVPTLANGSSSGVVYTTSNVVTNTGYTPVPIINGVPYYKDTDTKVTSADNHYDPNNHTTGLKYAISAITRNMSSSESGFTVVENISMSGDSKGHITSIHGEVLNISLATATSNPDNGTSGLMDWHDKLKLDGVSAGATKGTTLQDHYQPSITTPTTKSRSSITGNIITNIDITLDERGHVKTYSAETATLGNAALNSLGLVKTTNTASTVTNEYDPTPIIDGVPYYKRTIAKNDHYMPAFGGPDIRPFKLSGSTLDINEVSTTGFGIASGIVLSADTNDHVLGISGNTVILTVASATTQSGGSGRTGLMSWQDKLKLDGIQAGAEVNVMTGITIGSTTVSPGSSDSKKANITTAIDDYFGEKISSAIIPRGTKATVPSLSNEGIGNMYNMSAAFTIDNTFVEYEAGVTKTYPAGTNIYVVNTAATGQTAVKKWDVLAGFVDLSGYVLSSDLTPISDATINALS